MSENRTNLRGILYKKKHTSLNELEVKETAQSAASCPAWNIMIVTYCTMHNMTKLGQGRGVEFMAHYPI